MTYASCPTTAGPWVLPGGKEYQPLLCRLMAQMYGQRDSVLQNGRCARAACGVHGGRATKHSGSTTGTTTARRICIGQQGKAACRQSRVEDRSDSKRDTHMSAFT